MSSFDEQAHRMYRTNGPDTSKEAAERVVASGKADSQRNRCLMVVTKFPNLTAAEIAGKMGVDKHTPGRRLPELREAGLIKNGPVKICSVKGTTCWTWEAVRQQAQGELAF